MCAARPLTEDTPWGYTPGMHGTHMKRDIKRRLVRRLKIIEGQVRGLQRMVDDEKYCVDVITQASAVRKALSSVEDLLLENHLSTHVVHQMKSGEHDRATKEILDVYKVSKNK